MATPISVADVQIRAPREEELEAIQALNGACDLSDCGMLDSSLDQLQAEWRDQRFRPATDAWIVVTPEERVIGYATVLPRKPAYTLFYTRVHPEYRGQGLEERLLALIEKRAQEFLPLAEPDERVYLSTWGHQNSQIANAALEAGGYQCIRHTWAMSIEMEAAPAKPNWPEGIQLRPFVPERDARAVFEAKEEAFRDHWGYVPAEFEHWYSRMAGDSEQFKPELWFIAMDGEEIAGIALCSNFLDMGLVDILGVRRAWRRSGLGLALLHHAFGEFYRAGTHKVTLGVDSESLTGATRLYERAGMFIELVYNTYEKTLREGIDTSTRALVE